MKFLQQLDEAANIPLDQLKGKMKKDPRVKMIFQRSLAVEDLKDQAAFLKTVHYYLFNNPQVRAYIEKRGDRRDISKGWAKRLAATTNPTSPLKQMDLDWLLAFVKELFKDVGYVQKKDLSKRGHESLMSFFHNVRNSFDTYAAKEVDSLDLKPDGPITLYKGLLFDEKSFRSEPYVGYGQGLQFLKWVRQGKRTVDLNYDGYTLWTTNKNQALLQALYGTEASWRKESDAASGKIATYKGQLAFVISTLASPEDVVVDFSKYGEQFGYPTKDQPGYHAVVLKPGKRLARIVSRHTQNGEEDFVSQDETDDAVGLDDIEQLLSMFGRILKLPFPEIMYEDLSRLTYSPEVMKQIAILTDPEVQEKIRKLLNSTFSFYQKHLKDLDLVKLANQAGQHSAAYTAVRQIVDAFGTNISHKNYGTKPGYHEVKLADLTNGEDMLTSSVKDSYAEDVARIIATQKRWTDWSIANRMHGFAKIADPNIDIPEKLHLTGWATQKKLVDAAVDGFYMAIGKQKPESTVEQAKEFLKVAAEAKRVARAARFLQKIRAAAISAGQ